MRADKKFFERELEKIVKGLKKLGAKKIILFGSLARQEPRVDSDIDLLAIFDDKDNFKNRMQKVYSEITAQIDFDILAYNLEEYEKIRHRSLFRAIEKEGKVLYEARS